MTQTETVTSPQPTQTISHTTTVEVSPTTHTSTSVHVAPTSASQSSDTAPWWAWVLIGLAVVGIVIGIVSLVRGRHHAPAGSTQLPPPPQDRGPSLT